MQASTRGSRKMELAALAARCIIHSRPYDTQDVEQVRALAVQALPLSISLGDLEAQAQIDVRESLLAGTGQPASGAGEPVGVVDLERGAKVVCDCDARAAADGVLPGMALNSALALQPGLGVLARDPRRERALLEAVAGAALDFTPRVNLVPPDAVLLEVRGSLRLFGGPRQLCERLRSALRARGVEPYMALTSAPLASLWFARAGEQVLLRRPEALPARLAPLPLACTRWPQQALQGLATMGVRNVGDCLRLPRDGFARRFEPRLRLELDRALGRTPVTHDLSPFYLQI